MSNDDHLTEAAEHYADQITRPMADTAEDDIERAQALSMRILVRNAFLHGARVGQQVRLPSYTPHGPTEFESTALHR